MLVVWFYDFIYFFIVGVDGVVFSWFMDGFGRYVECVIIGFFYFFIVYDVNWEYVYGCGLNIFF